MGNLKRYRRFAGGFSLFLIVAARLFSADISVSSVCDDSAWANASTGIVREDGNSLVLDIGGFSQVYFSLPALNAGVQIISFEIMTEGQIENVSTALREIREPWTFYGSSELQLEQDGWKSCKVQIRIKEALEAGKSGFFMMSRGVGKLKLRKLSINHSESFEISAPPESASQTPLLLNSHFQLGADAWTFSDGARLLNSENRNYVGFPGNLSYADSVRLYYGMKYLIRISGSSEGRFRLIIAPPGRFNHAVFNNEISLKAGDLSIPFELKVPVSGALKEESLFNIQIQSSSASKLYSVEILPLSCADSRPEAVIACSSDSVRLTYSSPGKPIQVKVSATSLPDYGNFEVRLMDSDNNIVFRKTLEMQRSDTNIASAEFQFSPERYGYFRWACFLNGEKLASPPAELMIVRDSGEIEKDSLNTDFILGAHLGYWKESQDKYSLAPNAGEILERAASWGISAIRLHPPLTTKWWAVEPEPGIWTFNDLPVELPRKKGMQLMGLLDCTAKYASSAPEKVLASKNKWPDGWGAYPAKNIEDWRNYVAKTSGHWRNQIKIWEVWNEPDHSFFQMNPEYHKFKTDEYLKLLKVAYLEAKSVNPDSFVVAGAVTAGGAKFLKTAIEKGMLEYCDAVSFHGYGRTMQADAKGAEAFSDIVGMIKSECAKRSLKKQIWDSEAGVGSIPEGIAGKYLSQLALKSIIARRAAGISAFFIYNGFKKDYPGHDDCRMLMGYAGRPLIIQGLLSAYAALLGNTVYSANLGDDSAGIHLYSFRRADGSFILAGWAGKDTVLKQNLVKAGMVLDQFGNPQTAFEAGEIPLSTQLRYFK